MDQQDHFDDAEDRSGTTRAGPAEEFHRQFEAALGAKGPHLIECQVVTPKEWAALEDYIHKNR